MERIEIVTLYIPSRGVHPSPHLYLSTARQAGRQVGSQPIHTAQIYMTGHTQGYICTDYVHNLCNYLVKGALANCTAAQRHSTVHPYCTILTQPRTVGSRISPVLGTIRSGPPVLSKTLTHIFQGVYVGICNGEHTYSHAPSTSEELPHLISFRKRFY
jgi:hypothetical protein